MTALFFGGFLFAQERKEPKKEIKSVKKTVRLQETKEERKMTIVTDENGKKTEVVFKGKEAETKMNSISNAPSGTKKEVTHRQVNDKKVTLKTNSENNVKKVDSKRKEQNSEETKKMKVKKREKVESKLEHK